MTKKLATTLLLAASCATGCAFTDRTVSVSYDRSQARQSPIRTLDPLVFRVEPLEDGREDTERIGYKRNGFGKTTADILSAEPVTDVVREALVALLEANRHSTSTTGGDVTLSGEVTDFWFTSDINTWDVELMGTVGAHLRFEDSRSGELLHERSYVGHYNAEGMAGSSKVAGQILELALVRLIRQVRTDPGLLQALRSR
ncbi:MAG: hypothetical protein QNK04_23280 [Myxococcota bacterium]|nr:hypothetical protein [Myxococcota bacterium]